MRIKFLEWYTQALGGTLGILACIYAYLNGYMFVYGNIGGYFDFLGFRGVTSSYLLFPLCILNLFLGLIRSYTLKKEISNTSLESFNYFIIIFTAVIGFMGARIYFTIPAIFILFNILEPYLHNLYNERIKSQESLLDNNEENDTIQETMEFNKMEIDESSGTLGILVELELLYENKSNDSKVLETKKEIARELLMKSSSKQFIIELTGFTLDEIYMLEKECRINNI